MAGASVIRRAVALATACLLIAAATDAVATMSTPAGASPAILYVSSNGVDSGGCSSPAEPCATITYALSQDGGVGVTIEVSGTVVDNVTATGSNSPWNDPVTVTQMPGEAPAVVDGNHNGPVFNLNGADIVLQDLTIEHGNGSGIYSLAASLTITDCTITDNTATTSQYQSGAQGGGIWSYNSGVTITDSTISGNSAIADGGGASTASGGGIFSESSNLFVTNSTIADNSARATYQATGGGIDLDQGGEAVIASTTLSGNSATGATTFGAAIMDEDYDGVGPVTLAGDILASPGGPPDGGECAYGGLTDAGYNIDDDGSCGLTARGSISHATTIDGSLGVLKQNGGPTASVLPSSSSPAARVIPPSTTVDRIALCSGTDQRGAGFPRPAPGAPSCSIGAVEAAIDPSAGVPTTTSLSVDPASATADTPVTLTAAVSTTATGVPLSPSSGTVSFYDNGASGSDTVTTTSVLLGSESLGTAGTATLTESFFPTGRHDIVSVFTPLGTSAYGISTSLVVLFTATPSTAAPDAQTLEVGIPAGSLIITTPYDATNPFQLGTANLDENAVAFRASAEFGSAQHPADGVSITDTRAGDLPWTASVEASDFTSSGTPPRVISSQNLAFTDVTPTYITGNALQRPDVATTDVTSSPPGGDPYAPTASGTDGLRGEAHQLASAATGAGSVYLDGTLTLSAPTSTPAGTYTATLTFTVA